jgi:putative membrane protein
MKRFLPAAALAILLATPAVAQQMAPDAYVAAAGAGDLYEKTSSQLVLQSTKDPKVRSFAQGMIRDHNKSTAMVKSAATKAGLKPKPPVMTPEQNQMVAQLRGESGTTRDRTYMTQQQTAHQQALALHQGYAANGTAAPLKTAAGEIAPVVQHHIDMLAGM